MNMVSYNLSIYSKAVNGIIREICGERQTTKLLFYYPNLTVGGERGGSQGINLTGYIDYPHMVSHYL